LTESSEARWNAGEAEAGAEVAQRAASLVALAKRKLLVHRDEPSNVSDERF
jgi:hypothetical protein